MKRIAFHKHTLPLLLLAALAVILIHGSAAEWSETVIMNPRIFWVGDAFTGPDNQFYYVCGGDGLDLGTKNGDTWQFETISLDAEVLYNIYDRSNVIHGVCDNEGAIHIICPGYSDTDKEWKLTHWIRSATGWDMTEIGLQSFFSAPYTGTDIFSWVLLRSPWFES